MGREMMDRRRFGALLAMAGAASGTRMMALNTAPDTMQLSRNGWMPNNEELPVFLYRRAFTVNGDTPSTMETVFERNGWPAQWRDGVYDFHHYHSTAHEVLGFAGGRGG